AEAADAGRAELVLLARCVRSARGPGGPVAPAVLPEPVRAAVADAMAAADPLAEVLLDLACPACEAPVLAEIDVAAFVWAEVAALPVPVARAAEPPPAEPRPVHAGPASQLVPPAPGREAPADREAARSTPVATSVAPAPVSQPPARAEPVAARERTAPPHV